MNISLKYGLFSLILLLGVRSVSAQVPWPKQEGREGTDDIYENITVEMPEQLGRRHLSIQYTKEKKYLLKYGDSLIDKTEYDNASFIENGFIVKLNGKFGIIDTSGKKVLKLKYDSLSRLNRQFILAIKKGKQGVFSFSGENILPIKFHEIKGANQIKFFVVENKKGKTQLIDSNAKVISSDFDRIELYSNGAILVKGTKQALVTNSSNIDYAYDSLYLENAINYGYNGRRNNKIIPKKFVLKSSPLIYVIASLNNKLGLLDAKNNVLIPVEYDKIEEVKYKNYFRLIKDKKAGAYLQFSKVLIPALYDEIYMDGVSFFQVRIAKKYGLIHNRTGEEILPVEYDRIRYTSYAYIITKDKKYGLINSFGEWQMPLEYEEIGSLGSVFSDNYKKVYSVKLAGKYGVIDTSRTIIIPILYDKVYSFEKDYIKVWNQNKKGLFDIEGKILLEPIYSEIYEGANTSSKIFLTKREELYGLFSKSGVVISKPEIKRISILLNADYNKLKENRYNSSDFKMLEFEKGDFGVVDLYDEDAKLIRGYDGVQQILRSSREDTSYFIVQKGNKYGVIDHLNNIILDFSYDTLDGHFTYDNLFRPEIRGLVAKKNGKYGIINLDQEIQVPFVHEKIIKIAPNLFKVKRAKSYILIDNKGKVLNAGPFDEISNFEEPGIALTFSKGMMREINEEGQFITKAIPMEPHQGFTTFDEYKRALVDAMNSKNDSDLYYFAKKIAPSAHLIYFFRDFDYDYKTRFDYFGQEYIVKKYYKYLLHLKQKLWNEPYFNEKLLEQEDYNESKGGFITVERDNWNDSDHILVKYFLRNPIKVNGFWLCSYYIDKKF